MMVQGVSTIHSFLAALLIIILSYCSAENVYCVTPTATSCSSCPYNSANCTTLSEYARESEMYFTSKTIIVFLPGNHVLDRNITVENVTKLTMCGNSSSSNIATIVRIWSVGFSFTNVTGFNIHSLTSTLHKRFRNYSSHPAGNSALLLQSTQHAKLVNCSFHDNLGTALVVHNTNITLAENSEFINNTCACQRVRHVMRELGCGITAFNSNITFTGNTSFRENNQTTPYNFYECGGAIWASASSLYFSGANNFVGNSANSCKGGAIHASTNALLVFNGTTNFRHNFANYGSAIFTYANVTLNGSNNFFNNSAKYRRGGAVYAVINISLSFIGITDFSSNSASANGGAIHAKTNISLTFIGTTVFSNNAASKGGALSTVNCVKLTFNGASSFSSNSAMNGGAIFARRNSTLTFNGHLSFTNNGNHGNKLRINNAEGAINRGGAMYLALSSTFSILPHTTVCLKHNHATLGGAIYVSDTNLLIYCTQIARYIPREECFFQLPGQNLSSGLDVQLVFKNNTADDAGSVLYGGAIYNCKLIDLHSYRSGEVFNMLVHIEDDIDYSTTSKISSEPLSICPCTNNVPQCRGSKYYRVPHSVYPGETFQISVVAAGQRGGTVTSTVRGTARNNSINFRIVNLLDYQYLQQANNTCTKLNYTVFSLSHKVKLKLNPEGSPCLRYTSGQRHFVAKIKHSCPSGFSISKSAKSCVCEPRLAHYTNQCNITNGLGQITRDSSRHFWVGYDNPSQELILHPYCPFDYCVNDAKVFCLNSTDIQCEFNRSGLLCGRCKEGYSLVIGTHKCMRCTNSHLALLVLFAMIGVALIFLLLVCKLTVATGTISGVVFYANIVGANRTIFLPVKSTDPLSVFVAWINLDFGIETCFYNGMDAYSNTWLQFVFPVYIWVLVGLMVLVSHYSQWFANLLGSNPVSVLATLILLSYTKILHTLVTAVYFTCLEYQTYNRSVWLLDASVDYVAGKHIPLFLVAVLVFLFLFLPYTLLLLFGQWLQSLSHLKLFSWVSSARLKPFLDSYHAPYKAKHRYWPGLQLVLRCVLLTAFAFNRQRDPSINLLTILVGTGKLIVWAWISGGVYKNWCLDALEGSFALNLIVLGVATYHVQLSGGDQLVVGYTSVSIALVTFIGILAYHIFQQVRHTKLWKKVCKVNMKLKKWKTKQRVDNLINNLTKCDQLREPWLEDLLQPMHPQ